MHLKHLDREEFEALAPPPLLVNGRCAGRSVRCAHRSDPAGRTIPRPDRSLAPRSNRCGNGSNHGIRLRTSFALPHIGAVRCLVGRGQPPPRRLRRRAGAIPLARLRRGHSKKRRTDCPLLTLGLVLDASGFVRRLQVFAGNVREHHTLGERTSDPGFADAGRPGDEDVEVFADPAPVGERQDEVLVDAAAVAEVDVLGRAARTANAATPEACGTPAR